MASPGDDLFGSADRGAGGGAAGAAARGDDVRPGSRAFPMTVTQVVRGATHTLERAIGIVWVAGEVHSLSRPASGHFYFCLRDARSQISAVMWRSDARRLRFRLEDGLSIVCRGKLGVYPQTGRFQLYVQAAEPAGLGAEALALEQLKRALAAEGLFDSDRKRPIPHLPSRIGVVTSRSGAAVRDVIRAVQRRFPVPIVVADTRVQGDGAPRQIVAALRAVAAFGVDVVILGRGGGSAADLSAFNDEAVVRAVAACPVPTISAVGHEVDISLTDLVADRRAATPTMAGEMAVPVLAELEEALAGEERRLGRELDLAIRARRQELDTLAHRGEARVHMAVADRRHALSELRRELGAAEPRARLLAHRAELCELERRATQVVRQRLDRGQRAFAELAGRMQALSPLGVLERGYAIATAGGHVVTDAAEVEVGGRLDVRLSRGRLACRVESRRPEEA